MFQLFEKLQAEQPDFAEKITAVNSDLTVLELDLSKEDQSILVENINIVFHCAATIRFNEPLKWVIFFFFYLFMRQILCVIFDCFLGLALFSPVLIERTFCLQYTETEHLACLAFSAEFKTQLLIELYFPYNL